jgi:hypothetical protein
VAASGCAARTAPVRLVSTDWSAVTSLPIDTNVSVVLDGDDVRHGRVRGATASTLTLWEHHDAEVLPRADIVLVSRRIEIGTTRTPHTIKGALVSAVIAGAWGALVAARGENGAGKDDGIAVFVVGTLAGTAIGRALPPSPKYEEHPIYIRP